MTPAETITYYDDPDHAQSMIDLLMRAHPGWTVWRLGTDRTFRSTPQWYARREDWPAGVQSLSCENAGMLNLAMFQANAGARL
ncbi:hypothetical protein MF672_010980 [Actinomadura sp. ATCC 31491]|uniref:Uncharacterized protein n=1 Tax=Actinomadura luzonensis TaxID=2805427 RepID=A0ABT0FPU6_9ACTN|nr:hypothetical protein [Actinomadura luzonensis]MCK2214311.1 hypothetical protein [Actinomadura luzonensis]